MQKPEWEQKLPAGYRMATEADRGTLIGEDWKAWMEEWTHIQPGVVGVPFQPSGFNCHVPMCIPLQVDTSGTYPPLSQEAKDSMAQFHEGALEILDRVVAVPQEAKETERTYTLSEVKASMFPMTDFAKHVATSSLEDLLPLKSFTPNKYTRWMPTLDGRKVPVDVYCVLAAFPTGSAAVDHAVKKQLAPGQRGHKDRIQDLKEARDSLTRAIELEEAANAP